MGNEGYASSLVPWRGMLLYLMLGVAWVFAGDVLLAHWVTDPALLTRFQTWKGWGYVALTSCLAWWLLRRMRRAEKVRMAMAQELTQIVRHAPAGFARVARDGRFLWANPRLCDLLGAEPAQTLSLNFRDVMIAQDPDWAASQLQRLLAGEIDHYVGERHCQRLAATVVDNTMEGVVVTDAHSRILSVNAAFTRLLGYTEEELLGKTPRVFKSGRHDKAFYEAMWSTLTETGYWQGEIWNRRKNGEIFPEHMSLSAVRDPAGEITHYVCMFTDISEEKAQQRQLENTWRTTTRSPACPTAPGSGTSWSWRCRRPRAAESTLRCCCSTWTASRM